LNRGGGGALSGTSFGSKSVSVRLSKILSWTRAQVRQGCAAGQGPPVAVGQGCRRIGTVGGER